MDKLIPGDHVIIRRVQDEYFNKYIGKCGRFIQSSSNGLFEVEFENDVKVKFTRMLFKRSELERIQRNGR